MGIKRVSRAGNIEQRLRAFERLTEREVVAMLSHLGERCVRLARGLPELMSYFNHTHDLRSSIGYAVLLGGRVVKTSAFEGTEVGREAGLKLIAERSKVHPTGYALILVAGMHYAEYVERIEGKEVLASAELWARNEAPRVIKALGEKLRLLAKLRATE